MKLKLLLLTAVFCAMAAVAGATDNTANGEPGKGTVGEETKKSDIAGGVVNLDTGKPVGNVSVTAYSTQNKKEKVVFTDAYGNYSFSELKSGTYKLVFEKTGYRKVVKEKVTIRSDEGCELNIEMDEEGQFQIIPSQLFSDFD
jgi:5-hydroxyisourate hydrolase-like protein (transthyretin family)